jgi:hypothetical protein
MKSLLFTMFVEGLNDRNVAGDYSQNIAWCVLCVKVKLATTPKILTIVLSQRCAGFGARIAVWFRCSLNKQTANGNRV